MLSALHQTTTTNQPLIFLNSNQPVETLPEATHVQLGTQTYDLSTITNFYNEDEPQTLKAVIFSWLHDKSSIVDYKNQCAQHGIADFKFLVKTELNTWLSGNSDSCKFIRDADKKKDVVAEKEAPTLDPEMEAILSKERNVLDQNAALRGSKNIDFGYLVADAKKLIAGLKRTTKASRDVAQKSAPRKQPIIIVSPASTALLSLSNIKSFLEGGRYTEPNQQNRPANGLVILDHPSDRVVPIAQKIMVVDNVEMFTKPEYWDRVIAIFTSGQEWQFAKYKYSKPEVLFQNFPGFYLSYTGDPTPPKIKDWNVMEIKVDREKRFRDKMIVKDFWGEVDRLLVQRGYGA